MKNFMTPKDFLSQLPVKPYDGRTRDNYRGAFIDPTNLPEQELATWEHLTHLELVSWIISEMFKKAKVVPYEGHKTLGNEDEVFGISRLFHEVRFQGTPIDFIEDPAWFTDEVSKRLFLLEPGWCTLVSGNNLPSIEFTDKNGNKVFYTHFDLDLDKIAVTKP